MSDQTIETPADEGQTDTTPPPTADPQDRALIAMGAELERLWAIEQEASGDELERATVESCAVADAIMRALAHTVAGYAVKARAAIWGGNGLKEVEKEEVRGTFDEHVLQLVKALAGAPLPAASTTPWDDALADYVAKLAESERAQEEENAANERALQAAPRPEVLEARNIWVESQISTAPGLSFPEKADLLNVFREWDARYAAALAAENLEELSGGREEAAADARYAKRDLFDLPAPNVQALRVKLRLHLATAYDNTTDTDPDDPLWIQELLSSEDADQIRDARIYMDAVRLVEPNHPILAVQPFSAREWIVAFERYPGHEIGPYGPEYRGKEAYGPEGVETEDFAVNEPDRIAAYREKMVVAHPGIVETHHFTKPFIMGSRDQIAEVYEGDAERIADLEAKWDRMGKLPALGTRLWEELPTWKRQMVQQAAKDRDEHQREVLGANFTPEGWLAEFESCGGTAHANHDALWLGEFLDHSAPYYLAPLRGWLKRNNGAKAALLEYVVKRQGGQYWLTECGLRGPRGDGREHTHIVVGDESKVVRSSPQGWPALRCIMVEPPAPIEVVAQTEGVAS
jgi:hypothetical protein